MRAIYSSPSADYRLVLTKEELMRLCTIGHLGIRGSHIPVTLYEWRSGESVEVGVNESPELSLHTYKVENNEAWFKKNPIQFLHIQVEED